jgi:hypothetical protein
MVTCASPANPAKFPEMTQPNRAIVDFSRLFNCYNETAWGAPEYFFIAAAFNV